MKQSQITKVTIAGFKVAEVEVTREFAETRAAPERMLYAKGIVNVIFGFAALTEAYKPENIGPGGVFVRHVSNILQENWKEQPLPIS